MDVQYYGFTILLVWLQMAGLSAALAPRFGSWALGRSCGVLVVVMGSFLIEHFIGLGSLKAVWFFSSALAAWYLWKHWAHLRTSGFVMGEMIFSFALLYGLIWKYAFPNIYPSAERLTDLYFTANYFSGETLPPLDTWFPPYRFDFYYSLQHYGAALMGRVFNMTPGLSVNLAFPFLMALPITLAWDVAGRFIAHRALRLLLVATLVIGATGASVVNHFIFVTPSDLSGPGLEEVTRARVWGSARLIGYYERTGNTMFAEKFFPKMEMSHPDFRELPMENFGYQFFMGDYHPPTGGFFLLLLAVALIMALEAPRKHENAAMARNQQFLLGLTVPATIAVHTWIYPLHALMVAAWVLWRQWDSRKDPSRAPSWKALIVGGIAGFVLLYPFLASFATKSLSTPLKYNPIRTPLIPFIALMWPLLLLLGFSLFRAVKSKPAIFFACFFTVMLLFVEFVMVDDPTSGKFERGNSTLKWWGWIWTGALVALGAPVLGQAKRWAKWVAGVALFSITLVYAVDTAIYFKAEPKHYAGNLSGNGVYTVTPEGRDMFRYLATAPYGVVLENQYAEQYHHGGAYATFAAKPAVLGWAAHVMTWHGKDIHEIPQRRDNIRRFYAADMPEALTWLKFHKVRYIIWRKRDAIQAMEKNVPDAWSKLRAQLDSDYAWRTFGYWEGQPLGMWVKRD